MTRVSLVALGGVLALASLGAGCMPERLGAASDPKTSPGSSTLAQVLARSAAPRPVAARAYADGQSSDVAMRSVRATECIATAITNRPGDAHGVASENLRQLIAWAAPMCQQEFDALVTAYDRAYGAGLGLPYLRVYLRALPDELEARFRRTARATS